MTRTEKWRNSIRQQAMVKAHPCVHCGGTKGVIRNPRADLYGAGPICRDCCAAKLQTALAD